MVIMQGATTQANPLDLEISRSKNKIQTTVDSSVSQQFQVADNSIDVIHSVIYLGRKFVRYNGRNEAKLVRWWVAIICVMYVS